MESLPRGLYRSDKIASRLGSKAHAFAGMTETCEEENLDPSPLAPRFGELTTSLGVQDDMLGLYSQLMMIRLRLCWLPSFALHGFGGHASGFVRSR